MFCLQIMREIGNGYCEFVDRFFFSTKEEAEKYWRETYETKKEKDIYYYWLYDARV